ncbi:hypothetical protein AUC68_14230 [Methyloceanibacter methanicus]|uniref:Uncharacterized protein n=1 Tax=Methyloceanibacter methanicus TaxID=1774968 RepID=A0A1E3W4L0_9HYPH|nr:hypothetical protein [Methyloceanibacter methanicus]ODS00731.1 hypothetical protein AUC68_14230 [Methyloceanibacter methanicus]
MLKTTLLAAAALVAFGATAAYAGHDRGHDGDGHRAGKHGGYEHSYTPGPRAGRRHHHSDRYGAQRWHRYGPSWFDDRGRRHCHYAPRKVSIKVWDRRGNPYRKWVWKDVRVCV